MRSEYDYFKYGMDINCDIWYARIGVRGVKEQPFSVKCYATRITYDALYSQELYVKLAGS
jgi:hypothetical protein